MDSERKETRVEWSIQKVARLSGVTSRTLRHYDAVGLLAPSRLGAHGLRYYDEAALTRLQRILLLKGLGLGLTAIAEVLAGERDDAAALTVHLDWLRAEQARLDRQITAVETTIHTLKGGERLMAETMFDGFDHTEHRDEVEARWGAEAYAAGDRWWRALPAEEKAEWRADLDRLARDWVQAAERGIPAESAEAQELARRHVDWLSGVPGTPATTREYVTGLADMYVADPRFAANYGGEAGATFVRDALHAFVQTALA